MRLLKRNLQPAPTLPKKARVHTREIKKLRKERAAATAIGPFAGGAFAGSIIAHNPELRNWALTTSAGVIGGAIGGFFANREMFKMAHSQLTGELRRIAQTNTPKAKELREYLTGYKYIIVDAKGNIKRTNSEKAFGIFGRKRIRVKRILEPHKTQ